MQKVLDFLTPSFLRKLDRYLLLNHPRIWATKAHYIIFYGVLANITCILFAFTFFHLQLRRLYDLSGTYMGIVVLFEIGIGIFWLHTQSRFNIEKEYGNIHYVEEVIETIVHIICAILIFSPPLITLATGIYSNATYMHTVGATTETCLGPHLLNYFSEEELNNYDLAKMGRTLELAQNIIDSGVNESNIYIEMAAIEPEDNETSVFEGGEFIKDLHSYNTVVVEDGDATIKAGNALMTIEHQGGVREQIEKGKQVSIKSGDKVMFLDETNKQNTINVELISGKVKTSILHNYSLGRDVVFIVVDKVNNNIESISGREYYSYQVDGGLWYFRDTNIYGLCKNIKDFYSGSFDNDYFNLFLYASWYALLIILGVFSLQLLKRNDWRIVIYSILYPITLLVVLVLLFSLFSSKIDELFERLPFSSIQVLPAYSVQIKDIVTCLPIIIFLLFVLLQSARLFRDKKYSLFGFVNFSSLPISLGFSIYLSMSSLGFLESSDKIYYTLLYMIVCFLIYLFLTPILKRTFIYLMSLPKE